MTHVATHMGNYLFFGLVASICVYQLLSRAFKARAQASCIAKEFLELKRSLERQRKTNEEDVARLRAAFEQSDEALAHAQISHQQKIIEMEEERFSALQEQKLVLESLCRQKLEAQHHALQFHAAVDPASPSARDYIRRLQAGQGRERQLQQTVDELRRRNIELENRLALAQEAFSKDPLHNLLSSTISDNGSLLQSVKDRKQGFQSLRSSAADTATFSDVSENLKIEEQPRCTRTTSECLAIEDSIDGGKLNHTPSPTPLQRMHLANKNSVADFLQYVSTEESRNMSTPVRSSNFSSKEPEPKVLPLSSHDIGLKNLGHAETPYRERDDTCDPQHNASNNTAILRPSSAAATIKENNPRAVYTTPVNFTPNFTAAHPEQKLQAAAKTFQAPESRYGSDLYSIVAKDGENLEMAGTSAAAQALDRKQSQLAEFNRLPASLEDSSLQDMIDDQSQRQLEAFNFRPEEFVSCHISSLQRNEELDAEDVRHIVSAAKKHNVETRHVRAVSQSKSNARVSKTRLVSPPRTTTERRTNWPASLNKIPGSSTPTKKVRFTHPLESGPKTAVLPSKPSILSVSQQEHSASQTPETALHSDFSGISSSTSPSMPTFLSGNCAQTNYIRNAVTPGSRASEYNRCTSSETQPDSMIGSAFSIQQAVKPAPVNMRKFDTAGYLEPEALFEITSNPCASNFGTYSVPSISEFDLRPGVANQPLHFGSTSDVANMSLSSEYNPEGYPPGGISNFDSGSYPIPRLPFEQFEEHHTHWSPSYLGPSSIAAPAQATNSDSDTNIATSENQLPPLPLLEQNNFDIEDTIMSSSTSSTQIQDAEVPTGTSVFPMQAASFTTLTPSSQASIPNVTLLNRNQVSTPTVFEDQHQSSPAFNSIAHREYAGNTSPNNFAASHQHNYHNHHLLPPPYVVPSINSVLSNASTSSTNQWQAYNPTNSYSSSTSGSEIEIHVADDGRNSAAWEQEHERVYDWRNTPQDWTQEP